ncbi:2-C-methyl-D-erythritol 4-phosphate cytidylyltransferase [Sinobacterium caligoides]|uniref:2-C-methyl-D-erythritol 4-phosphate cytidylyltransferase n=1 Tax=Sinobacterium caligoides TaxID=933926 RepID=A0A3N2DQG3_9GAMM|nr:2-C-methyl-D-erythritol 4-phosphate cytidylyltransferase [Sinobacterium caligoides]ROS01849.1 2-C-methyl-D-erythritol 4-phosphate cytidylyltransferase [Sinobacterium caligoides]
MLGAIVLAAGEGSRFGEKKQHLKIEGESLWEMVTNKAKMHVPRDNIVVVGIDIQGGNTRTASVKIGLNNLSSKTTRVIILEAARPLVTAEQIDTLLTHKSKSVSFYMDLVDTVIAKDGRYLNRSEYCNLQTPQAFDYALLLQAYSNESFNDMTDETRVIFESHGLKPTLIEGGMNLLKVTYKKDYHTILNMINEGHI